MRALIGASLLVVLLVAPEGYAARGHKLFDELDRPPPPRQSSAITWDGTVVWNSLRFEGTYDNKASDCALGRVNTQLAGVQSYVSGVTVDGTNGRVSADTVVNYPHGASAAYPYTYETAREHVIANDKYLRFWHGARSVAPTACNESTGRCTDAVTIALATNDERGQAIPPSFFAGKRAFIMLRGVDQSYGGGLDYVKKLRDAELSASLSTSVVPADGKLTVRIATSFSGDVPSAYTATVYFTIGLYDASAVTVSNLSIDPASLTCRDHACSGYVSKVITGAKPLSPISAADVTSGKAVPMFVGLTSWGFDYGEGIELKRLRAGARLAAWDPGRDTATVEVWGEAYRADCDPLADGSREYKTNRTAVTIVSCKTADVCQAMHGEASGQVAAWTQKKWNEIKSGFKALSDAVVKLVTPQPTTFAKNEILVVLREGETSTALSELCADYGRPVITKAFAYLDSKDETDAYVERAILQPGNIRTILQRLGIKRQVSVPPLHRFYLLRFPASMTEAKRDDAIERLSAAAIVQHAAPNYLAKLAGQNATKSLGWFKPYLQTWWPMNNLTADLVILFLDQKTIERGMAVLAANPDTNAANARVARFAFDAKLASTHFQFAGIKAYSKKACVSGRCRAGEIFIAYAPGVSDSARATIERTHHLTKKAYFKLADSYLYRLPPHTQVETTLEALQREPSVFFAEPNGLVKLSAIPPDEGDLRYLDEWHLHSVQDPEPIYDYTHINAERAWARFSNGAPGSNDVVVAIIDSGLNWRHTDFYHRNNATRLACDLSASNLTAIGAQSGPAAAAEYRYQCLVDSNIFLDPNESQCLRYDVTCPSLDSDGNGYDLDELGWNFTEWSATDYSGVSIYEGNSNVADELGHGTAVAGLIGAVGDNHIGLTGVAWRVKLLPIKITDGASFEADFGRMQAAIEYAVDKGARIVNMSLGTLGTGPWLTSGTLQRAIERAANTLFVVAAGNDAADIDAATAVPVFPASLDNKNILTVVATTYTGKLDRAHSNFGSVSTDIGAPGVDLPTLDRADNNLFAKHGGTSVATPLVSGAAALALSYCPGLTTDQLKTVLIAPPGPSGVRYDLLNNRMAGETSTGRILDLDETLFACAQIPGATTATGDCAPVCVTVSCSVERPCEPTYNAVELSNGVQKPPITEPYQSCTEPCGADSFQMSCSASPSDDAFWAIVCCAWFRRKRKRRDT